MGQHGVHACIQLFSLNSCTGQEWGKPGKKKREETRRKTTVHGQAKHDGEVSCNMHADLSLEVARGDSGERVSRVLSGCREEWVLSSDLSGLYHSLSCPSPKSACQSISGATNCCFNFGSISPALFACVWVCVCFVSSSTLLFWFTDASPSLLDARSIHSELALPDSAMKRRATRMIARLYAVCKHSHPLSLLYLSSLEQSTEASLSHASGRCRRREKREKSKQARCVCNE